MRSVFVVVMAIAVIALCTVARGDEDEGQRADALTREGTSHFRLNEFEAALKSYQESYRLKPKPELLFNIGQCYRKLDRRQEAVDSFRSFLQESSDEGEKATVRELVSKLETAIHQEATAKAAPPQGPLSGKPLLSGRLRVLSDPAGAVVRFDDGERALTGTTPVEFGDLVPGTRRVFISRSGYRTVERNVDVVAGGTALVDIQLNVIPPEPRMDRPSPSGTKPPKTSVYKRWWLWTTVGAVAVTAIGVGLGVGLSPGSAAPSANTSLGTFRF